MERSGGEPQVSLIIFSWCDLIRIRLNQIRGRPTRPTPVTPCSEITKIGIPGALQVNFRSFVYLLFILMAKLQ
jgi:hypothetical protein